VGERIAREEAAGLTGGLEVCRARSGVVTGVGWPIGSRVRRGG